MNMLLGTRAVRRCKPVKVCTFYTEVWRALRFSMRLLYADDFRVEEFYVAPAATGEDEDVPASVYASSGKYIDPVSLSTKLHCFHWGMSGLAGKRRSPRNEAEFCYLFISTNRFQISDKIQWKISGWRVCLLFQNYWKHRPVVEYFVHEDVHIHELIECRPFYFTKKMLVHHVLFITVALCHWRI